MKRNCSIDFCRLFFAIQIVALHSSPLLEKNSLISYVCSQCYSRLAVPFFVTVAGYYFYKNDNVNKYKSALKKYSIVYLFWSCVFLVAQSIILNDVRILHLRNIISILLFKGWFHLWYILALLYIIVFLYLGNKLTTKINVWLYPISLVLLFVGIAISNYGNLFRILKPFEWLIEYDYILIKDGLILAVPFFLLGYKINMVDISKVNRPGLKCGICVIGFTLEILLTTVLNFHVNVSLCAFTYPLIFYLIIFLLTHPSYGCERAAQICSRLSSTVYYIHYILVILFERLLLINTEVFLLSAGIPVLIGLVTVLYPMKIWKYIF